MTVSPIPAGFHTITPFLVFDNAQGFSDFLEKGLGAKIHGCYKETDKIKHASAQVGNSMLMFADANEHHPAAPGSMFYLYVEGVSDEEMQKRIAQYKDQRGE